MKWNEIFKFNDFEISIWEFDELYLNWIEFIDLSQVHWPVSSSMNLIRFCKKFTLTLWVLRTYSCINHENQMIIFDRSISIYKSK